MALKSRPAQKIDPGVRWQRPEGEFRDEPDVARAYARLCRRGTVRLKRSRKSKHERRSSIEEAGYLQDRVEALARLAASDGYKVDVGREYFRLGHKCVDVKLVGPLDLSTADPRPALRMSAERLYTDLKEHGWAWYGSIYERHALLEKSPWCFVADELDALAACDGQELDWDRVDDVGYRITFKC